MPQPRLRAPEAIQSGGFQGGVFVAPEQAPQGGGLTELASALGRLNPSLDRAMVTRETDRIDRLREAGDETRENLLANELAGYNAQQLGEFIESDEAAQRFLDNPYILPGLQVHRGRVLADERIQSMVEQGINPRDTEAVQEFLQANAPDVDDPFFSRGFNEQLQRRQAQLVQMQFRETLEAADSQRLEMGQREFDTVLEDTGDPAQAFAALAQTEGVEKGERTQIQMATAQRLADAGDIEGLEALLTTPRDDAPALASVTELAQTVGTLRNRARVRSDRNNRDGFIRARDSMQEDILAGRYSSRRQLENDPRYQLMDEGFRSQVRGYYLSETVRAEREAERELEREQREQEQLGYRAAEMDVDTLIAEGVSLEDLQSSEAWGRTNPDLRPGLLRRARAAIRSNTNRSERAQTEAWEQGVEQTVAASDVSLLRAGQTPLWEDVDYSNEELRASHTVTRAARRRAATEGLREAVLGEDPWNLPEGQEARYAEYARTLTRAGLEDPQLNQLMDSARGLLTTEVVTQGGFTEDTRRVFDIYRQLDRASRSAFVTDTRTRAIMGNVEQRMGRNPEADFGQVLQSAVAQYELRQDFTESFDRDFTRYENSLDYTLTDPETGRDVNAARIDRFRDSTSRRRNDPNQELRAYAQEKFLEYRAAGQLAEDAARMASEDMDKDWTILNGRPLRLPPSRVGGEQTGPVQWSRAVDAFLEAEAFEHGVENYEDLTVSHLDNGVYAVRRPDGSYRMAHASSIMIEAGEWLEFSIPREAREAARDAGAVPTNE